LQFIHRVAVAGEELLMDKIDENVGKIVRELQIPREEWAGRCVWFLKVLAEIGASWDGDCSVSIFAGIRSWARSSGGGHDR